MPVFDFSNNSSNENTEPVCTYTTFMSNAKEKTPQEPIFVLDNSKRQWAHHAIGKFTNQIFRTSFEFKDEGETYIADIRFPLCQPFKMAGRESHQCSFIR